MQLKRTIICLSLIVVIIVACAAPVFAAAGFGLAYDLMSLWGMYCESVGIATTFSTNGIKSNFSSPFSAAKAADNILSLYDQYCTYSGLTKTLAELVPEIKQTTQIAVSNQQTGAFRFAEGTADFFNKFTTWVLTEVVGQEKNEDGLFDSSVQWFHNQLYYSKDSSGLSYGTNHMTLADTSVPLATQRQNQQTWTIYLNVDGTNYDVYVACAANLSRYYLLCDHQIPSGTIKWRAVSQNGTVNESWASASINTSTQINGDTWYYSSASTSFTFNDNCPVVSYFPPSSSDVLVQTDSDGHRIQLGPKDLTNGGVLGIPDVDAEDYAPDAITGVTTLANDGTLTIDDILSDALTKILANQGVLADVLAQPSVVTTPYLPFTVPSFSLGLSGIWHYVTEWVASLGSGLGFVSTIWANIPYAMVVPIFAAAVIVIVTSIFKRFV